jgi:hypothetical protein
LSTPPPPPEKISLLFRAVIVLAAIFCITIFAMVAALMGDGGSPAMRFLNEHGGTLIAVEVVATLFVILGAMFADRWKTLRAARQEDEQNTNDT